MNSFFRWLNDRGIRDKLLIYITIPVAVIIFFSFIGVSEKYRQYVNSKNTQSFLTIVIALDNLIHELQKERGISAGIQNIKSNDFQEAISPQRLVTDQALQNFLLQREKIDIGFLSLEVRNQLSNLEGILKQLSTVRTEVDKHQSSDVVIKYSDINLNLISFIQYLELMTTENQLPELFHSYINLLWLQERAGQERASLVQILSSKYMHADYYRRLLSYIEAQETLIRNYDIRTPLKYRQMLQEKLSDPFNGEVERYRDATINKIIRNEFTRVSGKTGLCQIRSTSAE